MCIIATVRGYPLVAASLGRNEVVRCDRGVVGGDDVVAALVGFTDIDRAKRGPEVCSIAGIDALVGARVFAGERTVELERDRACQGCLLRSGSPCR